MAILSQIRLNQLTGSVGTGADVGPASAGDGVPLDGLTLTGLAPILQEFANSIARVQGTLDWSNTKQGQIAVSDTGNFREMSIEGMGTGGNKRLISISNTGSVRIQQVGDGGEGVTIRTGDGAVLNGGAIRIKSEGQLVLSSSQMNANAIFVSSLGGLDADLNGDVVINSSGGGISLHSSGAIKPLVIAGAAPGGSLVMSASEANADYDTAKQPRLDLVAKSGIHFFSSGSADHNTTQKFGMVGPRTTTDALDFCVQATGGVGGGLQLMLLAANDNDAVLSGSRDVFFGDRNAKLDAGSVAGGRLKLSDTGEFTTYVTNFSGTTSLIGALNDLKASITSTEPTLFKQSVTASNSAGSAIAVVKNSGDDTNLGAYKTNKVQLYLNGQLLVSASGGSYPAGEYSMATVTGDGDYAIVGDGTGNRVRFAFALEVDDQLQVINHA